MEYSRGNRVQAYLVVFGILLLVVFAGPRSLRALEQAGRARVLAP